jgi:hypothetical protein
MSGQISGLWSVVVSVIGVAGVLLGGRLSDRLEAEGGDRAFPTLLLVPRNLISTADGEAQQGQNPIRPSRVPRSSSKL